MAGWISENHERQRHDPRNSPVPTGREEQWRFTPLAGLGEFMIIPRQWRSMPGAGAGISERPGASRLRQQAAYRCARGHAFTVALAAGIEPPTTWGCRCGASARPGGSADPGNGQTEHDRCMAVLLRRRTSADLEQLLAERLVDTARRRGRPGTRHVDPNCSPYPHGGRCASVRLRHAKAPVCPGARAAHNGTGGRAFTAIWDLCR